MKHLTRLIIALVLAAGVGLRAGEIKVQLVNSDGKKVTEVTTTEGGFSILRVSVQNMSNAPVTVNYLGAGTAAFMAKVEAKVVDPAEEVFLSLLLDNDALGVASNFDIAVGYTAATQQKVERTTVRLSAAEVLQFTPGVLSWQVGEAPTEKSATFTAPNHTNVVKALAVAGFDVRVDGNTIYAKPLSTAKALAAYASLRTAPALPANRQLPLGLVISE
jgi:hypothetical protein